MLQIPSIHILKYTAQVLGVILALLDDSDESVQLTAVSCLLMVKYLVSCVSFCYLLKLFYIQLITSLFCLRFSNLHLTMQLSLFCLIFQYGFEIFKCVSLLLRVLFEFYSAYISLHRYAIVSNIFLL